MNEENINVDEQDENVWEPPPLPEEIETEKEQPRNVRSRNAWEYFYRTGQYI